MRGLALGEAWHSANEAIRPLGAWEWAFDFRCRGCASRVRVVYAHDGEFAMSCYKYRVVDVIEEQEPHASSQPRDPFD